MCLGSKKHANNRSKHNLTLSSSLNSIFGGLHWVLILPGKPKWNKVAKNSTKMLQKAFVPSDFLQIKFWSAHGRNISIWTFGGDFRGIKWIQGKKWDSEMGIGTSSKETLKVNRRWGEVSSVKTIAGKFDYCMAALPEIWSR